MTGGHEVNYLLELIDMFDDPDAGTTDLEELAILNAALEVAEQFSIEDFDGATFHKVAGFFADLARILN